MSRLACITLLLFILLSATSCQQIKHLAQSTSSSALGRTTTPINSPVVKRVVESAIEQSAQTLHYDQSYTKIDYPAGDVPIERGACTDVIVRAFRKADLDLQKEVHEDMLREFSAYPQKWGLKKPDPNIDHRRVPNLMIYFTRQKKSLPISEKAADYLPGDVLAWDLGGGTTHIGILTNIISDETGNHMVAHNIGAGVRIEDVLFAWRIIGHYRYFQ